MSVWRSLAELPADLGRTVVTVGNFDGVHRGHQHLLQLVAEVGEQLRCSRVVAVTFDPHPFAVLRPEHAPLALSDVDVRIELLTQHGAGDVLVLPFTREIAAWSPERFVEEVLVDGLHAAAVVVGANFRFGHKAAGDVHTLRELGETFEFTVTGIELDGGPQVWSSTYVRNCLLSGDVEGAAEALGRPFFMRGEVIRGDQRGKDLGFPTANVAVGEVCAPEDGVYAGWLTDRTDDPGVRYPVAISVGTNPTFDGERERRVEAYVLDRDDLDLYGHTVDVSFEHRIRGMRRFESVEELIAAMDDDVKQTRELLLDT